jgi:hypothetical protein
MTENARPLPTFISVDDHAVESPTLWQDRPPRRWREHGPLVDNSRRHAAHER